MRIKQLQLNNFRGFKSLDISFQEKINVLVGENGAGKSSILDCLAIMLSRLIERIRSTTGKGRFFSDLDISNSFSETYNTLKIEILKNSITWQVTKARRGRKGQTITNQVHLKTIVKIIHSRLEKNEEENLPLAIYYPVNRAVLDIPLRIRTKHQFDQLSAYDQALTGQRNDFRTFFEWFRNREDIENETLLLINAKHLRSRNKKRIKNNKDKQLESTRKAVEKFLPGFNDLRVRRSPLRMTVLKDSDELIVDQLSDGEKCLLAMVGDLARRLALANPSLDDPLDGEGVVLIDEIDLHLHPSWQRMIIPKLCETFPHCQFIVSTHSPQVLSHVKPESIFLFKQTKKGIVYDKPDESYGKNSDRILEDLMGEDARPHSIKEKLHKIYIDIDNGKLKRAKNKITSLKKEIGEDPELIKADVLIHRKETIGK